MSCFNPFSSFKENYAFKGGTCLTKCYLGYYRFSEDLDFTFMHQKEFEGLSQKAIRKILYKKINVVLEQIVSVAKELGFDFKPDKSNSRYVMLGGNNKFVTFKLWYKSVSSIKEEFIKVQINYYELLINDVVKLSAHSLFSSISKEEIELLQPEYVDLIENVDFEHQQNTVFEEFVSENINYDTRVQFFALLKFFEHNSASDVVRNNNLKKELNSWMRVIRNLSTNTNTYLSFCVSLV